MKGQIRTSVPFDTHTHTHQTGQISQSCSVSRASRCQDSWHAQLNFPQINPIVLKISKPKIMMMPNTDMVLRPRWKGVSTTTELLGGSLECHLEQHDGAWAQRLWEFQQQMSTLLGHGISM